MRTSEEKLKDKAVKSVEKRVSPLQAQTQLSREAIIDYMVDYFKGNYGLGEFDVTPDELEEANDLVRTKFSTQEWIYALP
jgi:lipoate-protein ligase A